MNVIHLQRTSAFNSTDFEQCVLSIKPNDALVFIDDGCYCLTHKALTELQKKCPLLAIFHIAVHAQARAISASYTTSKPIDLEKLVALTFEYDSVITWQ